MCRHTFEKGEVVTSSVLAYNWIFYVEDLATVFSYKRQIHSFTPILLCIFVYYQGDLFAEALREDSKEQEEQVSISTGKNLLCLSTSICAVIYHSRQLEHNFFQLGILE